MSHKEKTSPMSFSAKIKKLRSEFGWSQGQLAEKIGSEVQRVSKYERGVSFPSTEMAAKIAKVFQVSLDYLILDEITTLYKMKNPQLIKLLEDVDSLPHEDQLTIIDLLDAYIKRRKFEDLALSKS